MKAIATLQNADGSYDCVGMSNRTLFERKTVRGIDRAALAWSRGKPHKVDYYYDGNVLRELPNVVAFKCGATI